MAQVTLDDLTFRYPGAPANVLSEVSLVVEAGEAHALLGPSGVGKTTLLNLLSGLLAPTSGRVLFGDRDVSSLPGKHRNVAQVFQFPVLYDSMTVAGNLAFPMRAQRATAIEIERRVDDVAAELGIGALLDRKPRSLSLFEKQLVAAAKALTRPDLALVLLDEPLTAVQPKLKWKLRQTLRKAQEDMNVTMIYVTHDQTEALTFADRVTVLAAEGIAQTGTPEEIYNSPAHEFVGHFVGSPGMNFLPCEALDVTIGDRVGFRPEWAAIDDQGPLQGHVKQVQLLGTRSGSPFGVTTIETTYGDVNVRGSLLHDVGERAKLRIDRYVAFVGGRQVSDRAPA